MADKGLRSLLQSICILWIQRTWPSYAGKPDRYQMKWDLIVAEQLKTSATSNSDVGH